MIGLPDQKRSRCSSTGSKLTSGSQSVIFNVGYAVEGFLPYQRNESCFRLFDPLAVGSRQFVNHCHNHNPSVAWFTPPQ